MTKADAIAQLAAAKAATPPTMAIRPNPGGQPAPSVPVSAEAIDGALAWVDATFDALAPTGIYGASLDQAIDFVYGTEPRWLAITVRSATASECTGLGVPGTYDGDLLLAANPTIEQVKAFFGS